MDQQTGPGQPVRLAAVFGLVVSIGVFVLVAVVTPDHGPTWISLRQGFVLMMMFAAPAIGAFLAPEHAAALGGGMLVAGDALTTPGGNLTGVIMMAPGLLQLLVATAHPPLLTAALLIRLLLSALALTLGVYLALHTGVLTGLGALLIAVLVAISGKWNPQTDPR